ncbi:cytochrome c biogenesis protein ResB [Thermodesulfobacterium sp. TA1]|uniref:cytochrome c biogenesis protein ResB n=1 Tax=Thermodesulfobacterium sp. TA1 TaxID=2234087 RepID=UPI00123218DF|nr:cytochrome c biogenesis protein ResB [Thermodesulfobacterium sp. TA1]QER41775.1 cytochrome c biogenesis protein ResB [Thermodesulfobacterium sp. TA1]
MKTIWDFFSSVKVAVVLFFLIAFFSILGTIIPQVQPPDFYLMKYGETFGRVILLLQLNDAYHSVWYVFLLLFFMINLITCSVKRFKVSWKLFKKNPEEVDPQRLPNTQEIKVKKDFSQLISLLKNLGFAQKETSQGLLFYQDKNRIGYLSVYLVHFSLVLMIIGAVVGAIWGFRGNMYLLEGEASNQVVLFKKENPLFLDFSVRLNKFIFEVYPDGTPKEYISNVTFIEKGNNTVDALIKVNHPAKHKGIAFYQASYEEIPKFNVKITLDGKTFEKIVDPTLPVEIADRYVLILEAYMAHQGFLVAKFNLLDQETGEGDEIFAIEGKPSEFKIKEKIGKFELKDLAGKFYMSVLQVKKDPGVWLVYAGFLLMILGLIGVYFLEPKTLWVFLKEDGEKILIKVGGMAKRDKSGLTLKLNELIKKLES